MRDGQHAEMQNLRLRMHILVERWSRRSPAPKPPVGHPIARLRESRLTGGIVLLAVRRKKRKSTMLILLIIVLLILAGGGGYYGHSRWGSGGGAGIGLGTVLVVLLVAWMLGVFH
jgi:hypothetical protein